MFIMVIIRLKVFFELIYYFYFFLDLGRFLIEKEVNGFCFFVLLIVGVDVVRIVFDGIYFLFENKLNNFI